MKYQSVNVYRLRRAQRGAAGVEAVVILPFFVLLFLGLFFMRELFLEKQQLQSKARTCAWLYSQGGCKDVPPGCFNEMDGEDAVRVRTDSDDSDEEWSDKLDRVGTRALENGDADGILKSLVGEVLAPVVKAVFGKALDADPHEQLDRPLFLGGEKIKVSGHYLLGCNVQQRDDEDVALFSWGMFMKD